MLTCLPSPIPNPERLPKTIEACSHNGRRLLEEAKELFELNRFSTAFALSVLAQEEFAKSFLLELVRDGALPWLPEVRRSISSHECKHLLAVVMEWLPSFDTLIEQNRRREERHRQLMAWYDRWFERRRRWRAWSDRRLERSRHEDFGDDPEPVHPDDPDDPKPLEEPFCFPAEVAAALNTFRHEKLERLRKGQSWVEPDFTTEKVRKIADGLLDRKKQSALYVDVTKTGEIGLHPGLITPEDASEEIKRAEHFADATPRSCSDEYQKIVEFLPVIFESLKDSSAEIYYLRLYPDAVSNTS